MKMRKTIFWLLVIVIGLGLGIWGLGPWIGGCASSQPNLIEATSTSTTTTTQTTTNINPPTSTSTTTSTSNSTSTSSTTSTTAMPIIYGNDWGQLGGVVATISNVLIDFKISKTGDIYIAYSDPADNNNTKVKQYSGGNWVPVGGAVTTGKAYFSLSIAGDGTLYVGYTGESSFGGCSLKKYSSGSWINVASKDVVPDGMPYLLVADDGTPYLAYSDRLDGYKAKVLKYSGGSWNSFGGTDASAGGGVGGLYFFIDGNTPYLAYQDSGMHGYLGTVRKYESGSWETVGPAGFTPDIPDPIQLFVSNNVPYFSSSGLSIVMSYESLSDSWVTIATNESGTLFVDNGIPYMASFDFSSYNLVLKKYLNNTWNLVPPGGTITTITNQDYGPLLAIFNGVPYVAFEKAGNGYPYSYNIYVTKYTGP